MRQSLREKTKFIFFKISNERMKDKLSDNIKMQRSHNLVKVGREKHSNKDPLNRSSASKRASYSDLEVKNK